MADSACSATAFLTGVKGNIETIGVSGNVANRDCLASNNPANRAVSSMKWAQLAGKRTGVVTNMRVTHATPAGAYANVAQRNWECDKDIYSDPLSNKTCVGSSSDIARQLIEQDTGRNLNVSKLLNHRILNAITISCYVNFFIQVYKTRDKLLKSMVKIL